MMSKGTYARKTGEFSKAILLLFYRRQVQL